MASLPTVLMRKGFEQGRGNKRPRLILRAFAYHSGMRAVPLFSPVVGCHCYGWAWCLNLGVNMLWHCWGYTSLPCPRPCSRTHGGERSLYWKGTYDLCSSKWHPRSTTLMEEYVELSRKGPEVIASHQPCSAAGWLWSGTAEQGPL